MLHALLQRMKVHVAPWCPALRSKLLVAIPCVSCICRCREDMVDHHVCNCTILALSFRLHRMNNHVAHKVNRTLREDWI